MMYEFFFPKANVRQRMFMIPHSIWQEYQAMPKDSNKQEKKAKAFLQQHTNGKDNWFTDQSPLFFAIESGILDCNGKHECIVKPI